MKVVLALLLCISAAFAAPFTVTPLTSGTAITGSLDKAPASEIYAMKYYKIDVPTRTRVIEFNFTNLDNNACDPLYFLMSSNGLPCNPQALEGSASQYLCDNSNTRTVSTDDSVVVDPRGLNNLAWVAGGSIYVGVGRRYSSDNNTCSYKIIATAQTCPGTTDVGVYIEPIDTTICYPMNPAPAGIVFPITGIANNVSFYGVNTLPTNTAYLRGFVNATTDGLNMYGGNYAPPTTSNSHCSITGPVTTGVYELVCNVPRTGPFYFFLFHDPATYDTYNATLEIDVKACNDSRAGDNCQYMMSKYDTQTDNGMEYGLAVGEWRYFYMDVAAASDMNVEIVASSNGSAYFYIRRNGYPADLDDTDGKGYDFPDEYVSVGSGSPATRILTAEDTYTAARWYMAVQNYDTTAPISFSLNVTITTPPAPTVETSSPGTTDEDSSFAVALFPSALIAALLAFFASFF